MTAIALSPTASRSEQLSGTGTLIRLALRRDRIFLAAWVLGITLTGVSSLSAIKSLYPDPVGRAVLASSIGANPAVVVLTGPVPGSSIGGLTTWRVGVLGAVMVALMAIYATIRRTRADEEAGRTELLASGVLGRAAPLTAALVVAWSASLVIGATVAAAAIGYGEDSTGSIILGGAWAGVGIVFAGVAAITAQLFESARAASATAGVVLGVAFALRAVADLFHPLGFLAWLSPLGWLERAAAFGGNYTVVLVLFPVFGLLAAGVATGLLYRRDIGLALFAARLGPADGRHLHSALALAFRQHRPTLIGWTAGLLAFGAITGGIADSAADLLKDNPKVQEIFTELGGPGSIADVFLAALASIGGILAGAAAISVAVRVAAEESAGRLEPVLATGTSRTRLLAGHLLFVVGMPVVILTVAGLVAGLFHGLRMGDLTGGFGAGLAAITAQIPAAMVMGALAAAVVGVAPRLAVLGWAALAVALLLGQLGPLLKLPRALLDVSPYSHVPALPTAPMAWGAELSLLGIAAVLCAVAITGFRRRDVG